MRYTIEEVNGKWVLCLDGQPITDLAPFANYEGAVMHLASMMGSSGMSGDGLLPERWTSPDGICFAAPTGPSRDFTNVTWSWRDPSATVVPLMLMTSTDMGHNGAELAGYAEEISMPTPGTPRASGRFYDTENGRAARDLLLDGRSFPVSVDPSENVEAEFICTETDPEWGDCVAGVTSFTKYEIAGLTMVPMAGFGDQGSAATIVLETADMMNAPMPMAASALSIPTDPPAAWLTLAEPRPGVPFLGLEDGAEVLVEQTDRHGNVLGMACPVTIQDDGLVYGHLTYWGACHTGSPWGAGVCASASPSATAYRDFHAGSTVCDDGTSVATGELVVGCEHSAAFDVAGVRDHLARAGMGWASVHVVDGEFGPWICGVLRPDLTENQVATLRRLSLSGEWVGELGGILAVNASGLPVQRERLAASALADLGWKIAPATLRASARNGEMTKLVGGNIVRRCPECAKRAALAHQGGTVPDPRLDRIEAALATIERRTRHLVPVEAEAIRASYAGNGSAAPLVV